MREVRIIWIGIATSMLISMLAGILIPKYYPTQDVKYDIGVFKN